jgi:transcriptional regulator with XRE-family HTH domain
MARKGKKVDMVAALRQGVRASGLSVSELSRRSGVSQPQLSRFLRGTRTLTLPAASRLAEALGLRLVGPVT